MEIFLKCHRIEVNIYAFAHIITKDYEFWTFWNWQSHKNSKKFKNIDKQAEKLKSCEMKDEGWKMNDESWKMKDEGWKMKEECWKMKD